MGKPRKTQHSGPLKRISVASWQQNEIICPVACIKAYIAKSADLRTAVNFAFLFIGSTRPHNPASSSTLGRWIKEQLREADVDTAIFSAHSTKSAAASKAVVSGISISTILNKGGRVTFAKFYRRETRQPDSFGSAILGEDDSMSE